jgi:hypothetical protein
LFFIDQVLIDEHLDARADIDWRGGETADGQDENEAS